jgi:hypothetical protein
MMAETQKDIDDLDRFFQAARQETAPLPDGLTARILHDAETAQAGFSAPVKDAPTPGAWRQVMEMLGGWPAMGGLATACAAGVWIGVAPPSFLPDPVQLVTGTQTDIDLFGAEDLVNIMSEEG